MNRRLTLLSGALVAILALSSCGAATGDDVVAEVGDATLSRDQLDDLTNSSTDGNAMRIAITNWVQAASVGGDVSKVTALDGFNEAIVRAAHEVGDEMFSDLARERYETGLESSGVLCLRSITLADPASAEDVLAAINDGLPFAEAAARFSADPVGAENGGLVTDGSGNACINASPDLRSVLSDAGAAIGTPVLIDFGGSFVVLLRPFEDLTIEDRFAFVSDEATGVLRERLVGSEPVINARYGRWNAEEFVVVPFSVQE